MRAQRLQIYVCPGSKRNEIGAYMRYARGAFSGLSRSAPPSRLPLGFLLARFTPRRSSGLGVFEPMLRKGRRLGGERDRGSVSLRIRHMSSARPGGLLGQLF